MLDAPQNPLLNTVDEQNPQLKLRRSQTPILTQSTPFLLLLVLVLLANAVCAVDYQEEWEEEEADVSHPKIFQDDFLI